MRALIQAAVLALVLVIAPSAFATGGPPSISQYVEVLPTSGGGTAVEDGAGNGKSSGGQKNDDAAILEKLVTSSAYGAPNGTGSAGPVAHVRDDDGALPAVANTVRSSGRGGLIALVLIMLGLTVTGFVTAARRRSTSFL